MLTEMTLGFDGGWVAQVDANLRWSGEVRCDRRFVGLVVGTASDRLHWAKTEVCEPRTTIVLDLHPLRAPFDTQLILIVGNGYLEDMKAAISAEQSAVKAVLPKSGDTGVLQEAFVVRSEPPASLGILFLAREDVRVGRTGVWRPRTSVEHLLPQTLMVPLQGGRKGVIEVARVHDAV